MDQLIKHYDLEVFTPPCSPGSERYAAIARLTVDISAIFPYLNAVLEGSIYNPAARALTCKYAGQHVTFNAYEIAFGNLEDRDEAARLTDELVEQVNCTWEQRDEIEPSYHIRQRPTPLAIYMLFPRTNCKACGEPTCYVFATKLAAGKRNLADCPSLREPAYTENLSTLRGILADIATM